jgi:hypothetical protein
MCPAKPAVLMPLTLPVRLHTAVTVWEKERLLLRRETASGMYTMRAWFAAKTLTVTPIQAAQTLVSEPWLLGRAGGVSRKEGWTY